MDAAEEALHRGIREAALARDWPAWDFQRQVLADRLEELDRAAEARMARESWRCVLARRYGESCLLVFECHPHARPTPALAALLKGTANAGWFLGCEPGSARVTHAMERRGGVWGATHWSVRISWVPGRTGDGEPLDTRAHPLGLAVLWDDQAAATGLILPVETAHPPPRPQRHQPQRRRRRRAAPPPGAVFGCLVVCLGLLALFVMLLWKAAAWLFG